MSTCRPDVQRFRSSCERLETLHPEDREVVAEIARGAGCAVGDVVAKIFHEAFTAKGSSGTSEFGTQTDPAYDESKIELGLRLRTLGRKSTKSVWRLKSGVVE